LLYSKNQFGVAVCTEAAFKTSLLVVQQIEFELLYSLFCQMLLLWRRLASGKQSSNACGLPGTLRQSQEFFFLYLGILCMISLII
jgi:hypothetical protein